MDGERDVQWSGSHQRHPGQPKWLGAERHNSILDVVFHRRILAQPVSPPRSWFPLRLPASHVQWSRLQEHLPHSATGHQCFCCSII